MISIQEVLNATNTTVIDGKQNVYSLSFVKADGSIRTIKRAARWTKQNAGQSNEYAQAIGLANAKKARINYNDNNLILITDLDDPVNPKKNVSISCIVKFNDIRVRH